MKLKSLDDLLVKELRDLYSAEKQLIKALPKMISAVTDPSLKAGLESHLEETRGQVSRLESIQETLGVKLTGHKCAAMEGLLKEGAELLEEESVPEVLDAAIIGACQRVEHYEIAGYGTARAFAEALGQKEIASTLPLTLDDEGRAHKTLNIAARTVNELALAGA